MIYDILTQLDPVSTVCITTLLLKRKSWAAIKFHAEIDGDGARIEGSARRDDEE